LSQKLSPLPWDSPEFYREAHAVAAKHVQFVEHQGKRILVTDCAGVGPQLLKAIAAECFHVVSSHEPKSLRTLIDVAGGEFSTDVVSILTELATKNRPYVFRSAVIGVTGLRFFALKTIISAAKRPLKLFDTRMQALDWLAKDEPGTE
jgi:hypothetical protein